MSLEVFWFVLIAILWAGYFVLEGFDFGVGILLPFLARDEDDRSAMLETIGPVWDGNEVWLVVAVGATFAAFPAWYATAFSGFYLALLLILVCLIVRVVSFEWGERSDDPRWRATWRAATTVSSFVAPFVWGVVLSSLVGGVPLNAQGDYAGTFWDLFTPYTVGAGIATVLLFALHGATFLSLRTIGAIRERAEHAARTLVLPAGGVVAAVLAWTVVVAHDRNARGVLGPAVPAALAVGALLGAAVALMERRRGVAFFMTALVAIGLVATIFTGLYPRVLVSDPTFANSLTVTGAASAHYTLKVITIAAVIFTPVVLVYQGWTYHVLRGRLSGTVATGAGD